MRQQAATGPHPGPSPYPYPDPDPNPNSRPDPDVNPDPEPDPEPDPNHGPNPHPLALPQLALNHDLDLPRPYYPTYNPSPNRDPDPDPNPIQAREAAELAAYRRADQGARVRGQHAGRSGRSRFCVVETHPNSERRALWALADAEPDERALARDPRPAPSPLASIPARAAAG